MKKYLYSIVSTIVLLLTLSSFTTNHNILTDQVGKGVDTIKKVLKDTISVSGDVSLKESDQYKNKKFTVVKETAHASYYHDKFNGRRTASGKKFSNNAYTAAHKNLPFGTKLKITNPKNKKSVIVTVNDRGPFVKGREIDLTKQAFKEISHLKNSGSLIVKIEKLNAS